MSPSTATVRATAGIHHVTAIAGDPQRNLDFYEGILGLGFFEHAGYHLPAQLL